MRNSKCSAYITSCNKMFIFSKSTGLLSNIEVVTTIKEKPNPVQQFATEQCLPLHNWPVNIPKNQYHIGLVVSFGHLIPEQVINKFK